MREHQALLYQYALRMGDSLLIVAQRFCELVGTAPILEEDIALANIGLDTLGQSTAWLELASAWHSEDKTADELAYFRTDREYTNYLISELENGDFARVIVRSYLMSSFLRLFYDELVNSTIPGFVAIAEKSGKEVDYHHQHLSDWVERLGLGTEESHRRMADALDYLWAYTQEIFVKDELEETLTELKAVPDKTALHQKWLDEVVPFLKSANLTPPECEYFYDGGTKGVHTEALGFLLAEMQSVARQYPDGVW